MVLVCLLFLSTAGLAQTGALPGYKPGDIARSDDRLRDILDMGERASRIGSGASDCESCPEACEVVCGRPSDYKCLAELRKDRARALAACKARRK